MGATWAFVCAQCVGTSYVGKTWALHSIGSFIFILQDIGTFLRKYSSKCEEGKMWARRRHFSSKCDVGQTWARCEQDVGSLAILPTFPPTSHLFMGRLPVALFCCNIQCRASGLQFNFQFVKF